MGLPLNDLGPHIHLLIVGAGAAGLATAAACLAKGLQPIVVEQAESIDNWVHKTFIQRFAGATEGLSDADRAPSSTFASPGQVEASNQQTKLRARQPLDCIRLFCRLTELSLNVPSGSHGRWRATFQDLEFGRHYLATADFVVLCTGHTLPDAAFRTEISQDLLSAEPLQVQVKHACAAQAPDVLKAKGSVIVVGDGDAAADCAASVALLTQGKGVRLCYQSRTKSDMPSSQAGVIDGSALLDDARRRALQAALQPHYTLPAPSAVSRALRAPTKRRFWAFLGGKAAAAVFGEKRSAKNAGDNGPDATVAGSPVATSRPISAPAVPASIAAAAAAAAAEPSHLVLWAPSLGDPRVLPFLEPSLRRLLLAGAESRELVLYRGLLHPDVAGLAFVGFESHARSSLLVVELQARWLVAHLTAKMALPNPAAMREDVARQRAWRSTALASHLMSANGSLARRYERHYCQQLMADLRGKGAEMDAVRTPSPSGGANADSSRLVFYDATGLEAHQQLGAASTAGGSAPHVSAVQPAELDARPGSPEQQRQTQLRGGDGASLHTGGHANAPPSPSSAVTSAGPASSSGTITGAAASGLLGVLGARLSKRASAPGSGVARKQRPPGRRHTLSVLQGDDEAAAAAAGTDGADGARGLSCDGIPELQNRTDVGSGLQTNASSGGTDGATVLAARDLMDDGATLDSELATTWVASASTNGQDTMSRSTPSCSRSGAGLLPSPPPPRGGGDNGDSCGNAVPPAAAVASFDCAAAAPAAADVCLAPQAPSPSQRPKDGQQGRGGMPLLRLLPLPERWSPMGLRSSSSGGSGGGTGVGGQQASLALPASKRPPRKLMARPPPRRSFSFSGAISVQAAEQPRALEEQRQPEGLGGAKADDGVWHSQQLPRPAPARCLHPPSSPYGNQLGVGTFYSDAPVRSGPQAGVDSGSLLHASGVVETLEWQLEALRSHLRNPDAVPFPAVVPARAAPANPAQLPSSSPFIASSEPGRRLACRSPLQRSATSLEPQPVGNAWVGAATAAGGGGGGSSASLPLPRFARVFATERLELEKGLLTTIEERPVLIGMTESESAEELAIKAPPQPLLQQQPMADTTLAAMTATSRPAEQSPGAAAAAEGDDASKLPRRPPRRCRTASFLGSPTAGGGAALASVPSGPSGIMTATQAAAASPRVGGVLHRVPVGASGIRGRASASAKAAFANAVATTEALLSRLSSPRTVAVSQGGGLTLSPQHLTPDAAAASAAASRQARSQIPGVSPPGLLVGEAAASPRAEPSGFGSLSGRLIAAMAFGSGARSSSGAAADNKRSLSGAAGSPLGSIGGGGCGGSTQRTLTGRGIPIVKAGRGEWAGGSAVGSPVRSPGGILFDAAEAARLPYRERIRATSGSGAAAYPMGRSIHTPFGGVLAESQAAGPTDGFADGGGLGLRSGPGGPAPPIAFNAAPAAAHDLTGLPIPAVALPPMVTAVAASAPLPRLHFQRALAAASPPSTMSQGGGLVRDAAAAAGVEPLLGQRRLGVRIGGEGDGDGVEEEDKEEDTERMSPGGTEDVFLMELSQTAGRCGLTGQPPAARAAPLANPSADSSQAPVALMPDPSSARWSCTAAGSQGAWTPNPRSLPPREAAPGPSGEAQCPLSAGVCAAEGVAVAVGEDGQGPASAVRQASQARQNQLVGEIAGRLREALARRAALRSAVEVAEAVDEEPPATGAGTAFGAGPGVGHLGSVSREPQPDGHVPARNGVHRGAVLRGRGSGGGGSVRRVAAATTAAVTADSADLSDDGVGLGTRALAGRGG